MKKVTVQQGGFTPAQFATFETACQAADSLVAACAAVARSLLKGATGAEAFKQANTALGEMAKKSKHAKANTVRTYGNECLRILAALGDKAEIPTDTAKRREITKNPALKKKLGINPRGVQAGGKGSRAKAAPAPEKAVPTQGFAAALAEKLNSKAGVAEVRKILNSAGFDLSIKTNAKQESTPRKMSRAAIVAKLNGEQPAA